MRKLLPLLLLIPITVLFTHGHLQAQKKSFPGYVIKNGGEKIEGEVLRGMMQATAEYTNVMLIPQGGKKKLKLKAEDLEAYEFDGNYYQKYVLESGPHILMRKELEGAITLYYGELYKEGEDRPHFMLIKGGTETYLEEKVLYDTLKGLVSDHPDNKVLLARTEYTLEAIRDIVSSYNSWAAHFGE